VSALTFAELAQIVVEGACDRFCGRPADQNPYSEEWAERAHTSWQFGWGEADWMIEARGQEEAQRWLEEGGS